MAAFARFNPTMLFLGAGLLGLAACTEVGYTKPGMTEEEYARDTRECDEIARHQAFRDQALVDTQWRSSVTRRHDNPAWNFQGIVPTFPEIEFRYRRVCMLSRGYELAPLESEDKPQ